MSVLRYALNQWEALTRFLEDGELEIDNGATERANRDIALGRGNWSTRMDAMSTASPKGPKGAVQTAATRKATIQTDYMILADDGNVGAGEEAEWDRIRSNIVRTIGIQRQTDKRVRIQSSVGTVFGHRDAAAMWTFYFQRLVCYEIWRDVGNIFKKKWQIDKSDLWYVADCREFWPNGTGHAV
jgi:hypothetical protein